MCWGEPCIQVSIKFDGTFWIQDPQIADRVVYLLNSLDVEIQQLCADIFLNVSNQRPDK